MFTFILFDNLGGFKTLNPPSELNLDLLEICDRGILAPAIFPWIALEQNST